MHELYGEGNGVYVRVQIGKHPPTFLGRNRILSTKDNRPYLERKNAGSGKQHRSFSFGQSQPVSNLRVQDERDGSQAKIHDWPKIHQPMKIERLDGNRFRLTE